MNECDETRSEWGSKCRKCKQMLPARKGPIRSWKAEKDHSSKNVQPPPPSHWLRRNNKIQPRRKVA